MDPVIVLEFNELTPPVMDRLIAEGQLPNFRKLRESSEVYTTQVTGPVSDLEPWIQWVTVHTGVDADRHRVRELGQADHYQGPRAWDVVSEAGIPVVICGSMNARFRPDLRGVVIPDPWSADEGSYRPEELAPYVRFVQQAVREHTNNRRSVSLADTLSFAGFLMSRGLTFATVREAIGQLRNESRGGGRWRRACLLDSLQWDVFRHYYRAVRPGLATFFLNSTAHFQHLYWRDFEPERFLLKPDPRTHADQADAIAYGYRHMDRLVGECLELAGENAQVVLCTAFSQQPHLHHETVGGKSFYRARDLDAFLRQVGLQSFRAEPVMAEEFFVHFLDQTAANEASGLLDALTVEGEPLLKIRNEGASLFCGCRVFHELPSYARLESSRALFSERFLDFFYRVDGIKSGRHHPEGMLWIRRAGAMPRVHEEKVALTAIAPTILSLLGLTRPAEMESEPLLPEPAKERLTGAA